MDRKDIDLTDVGLIGIAIAWVGRIVQTWIRNRKQKPDEPVATNGGRVITDMAAAQTRGFEVASGVLRELLEVQARTHALERDEMRLRIDELEKDIEVLRRENAELRSRLDRFETIKQMESEKK